jgi:hypothetical protein
VPSPGWNPAPTWSTSWAAVPSGCSVRHSRTAARANPALHLRRLDGGQLAEHYIGCFERVWDTAKPWFGEEV